MSGEKIKICVVNSTVFGLGDMDWSSLESIGELSVYHGRWQSDEELKARVADADIVLGNNSDLGPEVLAACEKLRLMCTFATGYDLVDTEGAAKRGIPVCNVPSYGTASVAQYAIALLLQICGQLPYYSEQARKGRWYDCWTDCVGEHGMVELAEKTMGIVGFGHIGQAVGRIARALGMNVIAYNRSQCDEGRAIAEYVSLDELFARSDVVSLHAPLNAGTKHIVNADSIAKMKDGVIIINNGRGGLVDSAALADALRSGKVWAAGLDVVEGEPDVKSDPLYNAPRCLITPHVSWLPKEARQRELDITADNIRAFLEGHPQNVVNGVK